MKITRRDFLKGMGAVSAAGALGMALNFPGVNTFASAQEAGVTERKELKGFCLMCKHSGCCNIVTVENGVVVNVEGDPDYVTNQGTLCARGKSTIMNLYNPYRVKAPMKRTNPEKGLDVDPGWVEISWDEALDTVAAKMREVYDNDPREFVYFPGFAMSEFTMYGLGKGNRLPRIVGSPNDSSTKGQFCCIHYGVNMILANTPTATADYRFCKYLLAIGRGGGINGSYAQGESRGLMYALENGMRLVCVDPHCSTEASLGEWVPIVPGTDLPFILSLLHVILYELDKYDKDFVRDRTNAPYLIGNDGNYARGANNKPLIWDLADGKAKSFDDPTLTKPAMEGEYQLNEETVRPAFVLFRESLKEYTPEWASEKCTIPPATIRQIASDFVESAQIGSTIVVDGHTFPYRPAAAITSRGVTNHLDGDMADVCSKLLNVLIGNIYVPGGLHGTKLGDNLITDPDGVVTPSGEATPCTSFTYPPEHFDLFEFMPHRHSSNTIACQVMIEPEKWNMEIKPKVLMVAGGNPILVNGSPEIGEKAVCSVPFVVTFSYHLDEIAQLADVVLAENCMLENGTFMDYMGNECSLTTGEPGFPGKHVARLYRNAVPPMHNTMEANETIIEILDRMGLISKLNESINNSALCGPRPFSSIPLADKYKLDLNTRYTYEEMWDRTLKTIYGEEYGLEYMKKHGHIRTYNLSDKESYSSYYNNTVRYQLYLQTQKRSGDFLLPKIKETGLKGEEYFGMSWDDLAKHYQPVPTYIETNLHNAPEEYDLYAITIRLHMSFFRLGSLDQNPWVLDWNNKYNPFYNSICVNPIVAEKHGFKEGDIIVAESQFGKTQGKVHITETMHPRAIAIPGALGRYVKTLGERTSSQTCFNALLNGSLGYCNPIHGGLETTARVKVYKA